MFTLFMNPCFAVLPYTFIPNSAQLEWSFLLQSCMKCAATTGIHPASHGRRPGAGSTSYQAEKLLHAEEASNAN